MSTESPSASGKQVSIICRTVGRPELRQCLESVARQSYANLELVLVNAANTDLNEFLSCCGAVPVVEVNTGGKLNRSQAANAGLEAATGAYLMFLDDDDWIAADHVENLVAYLEQQESIKAVYSSTQKVGADNEPVDYVFDQDFDRAMLLRDNYIPIHSMLFARALLDKGCRFDESLPIYEDWDFWLQLSQFTDFAHLDQITAYYRIGGESDTALEDEALRFSSDHPNAQAREKVFDKWIAELSGADLNQMLGSMDRSAEIARLESAARTANDAIRSQQQVLTSLNEKLREAEARLGELGRAHEDKIEEYDQLAGFHNQLAEEHDRVVALYEKLEEQHRQLDRAVQEILNSFSWRITAPYRFIRNRLSRYLFSPIAGRLKKNAVKIITKHPALHQAVQGSRARVSAPLSSVAANEKLYSGLESPIQDSPAFTGVLLIQGWAFTGNGEVMITAFIDGLPYRDFSPQLARPDVKQVYSAIPQAEHCGFHETLILDYLPDGPHTLRLELVDGTGFKSELEQSFYSFSEDEHYQLWLRYQASNALPVATSGSDIHVIFIGSDDIEAVVESLHCLEKQSWSNWQLHYLGDNWSEICSVAAGENLEGLLNRSESYPGLAQLIPTLREEDYLLGLSAGELLQPHALNELLRCAAQEDAVLVYSDHDNVNETGDHHDPVFTFAWSPDHLLCRNYLGNVFLLRVIPSVLKLLVETELNQWRYSLLLELSANPELGARMVRLAKVLWSVKSPGREVRRSELKAEMNAVEEFLYRRALPASVRAEDEFRYINWNLESEPLVSIIIPTMGKLDLLRPCLESLIHKTSYKNFELVMLDNSRGKYPEGIEFLKSKDLRIIECDEDFNWARLNNIGARNARGDYLLFLNDDIEVIDGNWLGELVKQAQRADVGAVGALLLYPNGAIQHAGVFLVDHGGGCAHLFHKMMPDASIYRRLDKTVREVSASTGACLMVAREKFEELDGFDEKLAVVGNDVDLCLRLLEQGYRNIWTPACCLIHHESISRKTIVPPEDEQAMWDRWKDKFQAGDCYYNPNLSRERWDCSFHVDVPAARLVEGLEFKIRHRSRLGQQPLQPGVSLIGYTRAEMGLGEGARSDARALQAAGIDFGILRFEFGNPGRMTDLSWQHKETLDTPYDVVLMHINPDFLLSAKQGLPKYFFDKRYIIGYWAWELEELPKEWIPSLGEVNEIWVPSNFVKSAVEPHAEVPVVTIPHCLDLEPSTDISRDYFDLPEDCFTFLAMFDIHSVAERKNPFAAINAFKQAFDPADDSVALVLKVNNSTGRDEAALMTAVASHPNIHLMHRTQTRAEINGLLTLIDCYVSLHRSEGFGLGPAEAMCLGKATIITNWSGSTDFMTEDNCMAIDYQLIELDRDYGPYRAGQRWADPDIEQAAEAMKTLAENRELAAQIGSRARQTIMQSFSPEAVGKLMKQRLDEIRKLRVVG